jgi:hypothetical protein
LKSRIVITVHFGDITLLGPHSSPCLQCATASLSLSLSLSLFLLVMKVKMVMPIRSKKARNAQIAAVAFLLMGFFSVC